MSRTKDGKNLRFAGLFIVVVLGLIFVSALFKFFLIVKTSRFDGSHNFIVSFVGKDREAVVSFSPQNRSLSILDIDSVYKYKDLTKTFEIPIDGTIISQNPNSSNISSMLLKSAFSFGQSLKKLTILDVLRLFLFSKTIPQNNIYERQENQIIQVINASNVQGLGSRLATLIANIGGNVILVSTSDEALRNSKILYYGDKTYTVKKISSYLGIPAESSAQRGVADVIIMIGKDKANSSSF